MVIKNTHFICIFVDICGTIKTYVHLLVFVKIKNSKLLFFDNQICFRIHIENILTKYTWLQKTNQRVSDNICMCMSGIFVWPVNNPHSFCLYLF